MTVPARKIRVLVVDDSMVSREFLVHELQSQIVAADIDDEGDAGLERGDVREVLIGSHTEVRTARHPAALQFGNDPLICQLIADEVVGLEVAAGLGHAGDQAPELLVGESIGNGVVGRSRSRRCHQQQEAYRNER